MSDRNLLNKPPFLGKRRKEADYMVPTFANLALLALGSFSLPAEQIMLRSLFIFSSCSLCGRIRKKQKSKCQGANALKIDITYLLTVFKSDFTRTLKVRKTSKKQHVFKLVLQHCCETNCKAMLRVLPPA